VRTGFLARYSPTGTLEWSSDLADNEQPRALAVDTLGSVYILTRDLWKFTETGTGSRLADLYGYYSDIAASTDAHLYLVGSNGIVGMIAKLNAADGSEVWTQFLPEDEHVTRLSGVSLSPVTGDLYVTGHHALAGSPPSNPVVARFHPDGQKVWEGAVTSSHIRESQSIFAANDGSVYISGYDARVSSEPVLIHHWIAKFR
jgi:outer membrane protein assembly factor BamB